MPTDPIGHRLEALARRYELSSASVGRLATLLRVLDDPLAPTALRDPDRAIDEHLADSLVALDLSELRTASSIADLGSGAGVPGLPLAIALPNVGVALVESATRKAAFLEHALGECAIANARVVNSRVESWVERLGSFDVVTARALAPLDVVVEYAAPLLRVGGTLVVWRGRRDAAAEVSAAEVATLLGLEPTEIRAVRPFERADNRHLHLMSKVMDTPQGFPRRPGMARKRPLAAAARRRRSPSDRARR
jgi:16S rRNA (guanine527-N7)-methyltransferase